MWNQNERAGKINRAKGKAKQVVGGLIHNDKLKAAGRRDEAVGRVTEAVGRVRRRAGKAIEKVKNVVKR